MWSGLAESLPLLAVVAALLASEIKRRRATRVAVDASGSGRPGEKALRDSRQPADGRGGGLDGTDGAGAGRSFRRPDQGRASWLRIISAGGIIAVNSVK